MYFYVVSHCASLVGREQARQSVVIDGECQLVHDVILARAHLADFKYLVISILAALIFLEALVAELRTQSTAQGLVFKALVLVQDAADATLQF